MGSTTVSSVACGANRMLKGVYWLKMECCHGVDYVSQPVHTISISTQIRRKKNYGETELYRNELVSDDKHSIWH